MKKKKRPQNIPSGQEKKKTLGGALWTGPSIPF